MHIAKRRLQNQRLVGAPFAAPADVVRWLGAVQAQDYGGAKWALGLRSEGVDDALVDRAFNDGAFLRTHVMRPTWHFVAPDDLRWLLALTSPRTHTANAYMYRKLDLNEKLFRRAHASFTTALRDRHALTRHELANVLEASGISARGQRLAYIVMQAELAGLLCSGPMRGKQHTYALLDERVPPTTPLDRDEALAALARRYFQSHGPATVHDFGWWSGQTVSDARLGLELVRSELEPVVVDEITYWTGPSTGRPTEGEGTIFHLLPNYDEHVIAYRGHTPSLDPAIREAIRARTDGPLNAHLVARNGMIVGGWRRQLERACAIVTLDLLVDLQARERTALQAAVEAYEAFIRLPVISAET